MENLKTVVIDNGTGYTKMGFAGNPEPSFMIPTCIAEKPDKGGVQVSRLQNDFLDFYIGDDAIANSRSHQLYYPIRSGEVSSWEQMEKFWHSSIYNYLKAEPEEHVFMLTEPPMNPPENRERMAETFFETFNAKGLYIGVQAVLAMISSGYSESGALNLTGTVVDSGDGVTHIIPVVNSDDFNLE